MTLRSDNFGSLPRGVLSVRRFCRVTLAAMVCVTLQVAVRAGTPEDGYALAAGHYTRGQWQLAADAFAAYLAQHPGHHRQPQALFYRAEALVQLGDLAQAREVFGTFLEGSPEHPLAARATFRAAEAAMLLGDRSAATAELERFLHEHRDDTLLAYALPYLGDMALADGHWATAEQHYRQALSQFPEAALANDCRLGLARAEIKVQRLDDARRRLTELAAKREATQADDAQLELALLEYAAEQDAAALAACDALLRRWPHSPLAQRAKLTRGWALFRLDRIAEAEAALAQLIGDPQVGPDAQYWTGLCRRAQKQWPAAADVLRRVLPDSDGKPWQQAAWFHAGDCLLRAGQAEQALTVLDSALERWPDGAWADDALAACIRAALDAGQHEAVAQRAEEFLTRFGDRDTAAGVRRTLAQSRLALKDFSGAAALLETNLEARPSLQVDRPARDDDPLRDSSHTAEESSADRYLLSLAYAGAGRQAEAAEIAAQVSDDAASTLGVDAQLVRAAALAAAGQHREALEPLQAYLAARPMGPEAARCRAELALCHARLGDIPAAKQAWEQLLGDWPNHETLSPTALQLAELCQTADDLDWAGSLYEYCAAHGNNPERRARGQYGVAWRLWKQDQKAQAAEAFQQVLTEHPATPVADDAALALGSLYEQLELPEQALAAYGRLTALERDAPQRPTALLAAARLHGRLQQDRKAAERLQEFLHDYPEHAQREAALYELGWSLREDGQQEPAEATFLQLRHEFPRGRYTYDAAYRLAEQAFQSRQYDVARTLLDELVGAAEAAAVREHALYLAARTAAAQERWADVSQAARQLVEEFPQGSLALQAEYWSAEALFRQGEHPAAADALAALRKKLPAAADAWWGIVPLRQAQCYAHLQQWPEARDAAAAVAQEFPGFAQQYEADYVLGRSLAALGELVSAREAYQRTLDAPAAAKSETAAQAQLMLAETYYHQRDFTAAVREYLAVEILYDFPELQAGALWQAARCYEQLQQPADAAQVYRRLADTFPNSPYAEQARQRQAQTSAAAPSRAKSR